MERFMGMMPISEIKIEEHYKRKDEDGIFIIQAGPHGYSILFPDHGAYGKDVNSTSENNRDAALQYLKESYPGAEFLVIESHDKEEK